MDLFEAIKTRRSVRKFTTQKVESEMILKALEAATQAPNSSNTQTWDFYWPKNAEMKKNLAFACLNQSAARTAAELIVITANPNKWKRSQKSLIKWAEDSKAHPSVVMYYKKIVPLMYTSGFLSFLAPFKWLLAFGIGLFRPVMRGPYSTRDVEEIGVKSAALAAENFVLAMAAQGVSTCMMEGFDSWKVKRLFNLSWSTRVVMVIAVGYPDAKGIWGEQFRLPSSETIHIFE
jgi:nitroreductase